MTYVAFGPLGPWIAVAVSRDLRSWERLGPVLFGHEAAWDVDFNLYPNKDALFFPEPIPGPDGEPCYAMLHRPMWHADWLGVGDALVPPAGIDERPGIWISYVTAAAVEGDLRALTVLRSHRCVAVGEFSFESAKIGGGPPPIRVTKGGCSSTMASPARYPPASTRPRRARRSIAPGPCCSIQTIRRGSSTARPNHCCSRKPQPSRSAPWPTSCSRPRSRRSASGSSSSTAWPTLASAWPSSAASRRDGGRHPTSTLGLVGCGSSARSRRRPDRAFRRPARGGRRRRPGCPALASLSDTGAIQASAISTTCCRAGIVVVVTTPVDSRRSRRPGARRRVPRPRREALGHRRRRLPASCRRRRGKRQDRRRRPSPANSVTSSSP